MILQLTDTTTIWHYWLYWHSIVQTTDTTLITDITDYDSTSLATDFTDYWYYWPLMDCWQLTAYNLNLCLIAFDSKPILFNIWFSSICYLWVMTCSIYCSYRISCISSFSLTHFFLLLFYWIDKKNEIKTADIDPNSNIKFQSFIYLLTTHSKLIKNRFQLEYFFKLNLFHLPFIKKMPFFFLQFYQWIKRLEFISLFYIFWQINFY